VAPPDQGYVELPRYLLERAPAHQAKHSPCALAIDRKEDVSRGQGGKQAWLL